MDRKLLLKFLRCQTSPHEEALIADWLDESPENRSELDALQLEMESMILYATRLRHRWPQQSAISGSPVLIRKSVSIAAAVLIAVVIGVSVASEFLSAWKKQRTVVEVPAGQRISITLSDGTVVWLNSETRLEIPSVFTGRQRRVRLEGEAMFDVEHDARGRFIVETFACEAEALGTKFNVVANQRKSFFSASLLEGKLRISMTDTPDSDITLLPGQTAAMTGGRFQLSEITDHDEFLWIDGMLNLNNLTFAEVMAKFESCYGVRIIVETDETPQTRFRGKFRIAAGVDYALQSLQMTSDFSYAKDERTNTIYIR